MEKRCSERSYHQGSAGGLPAYPPASPVAPWSTLCSTVRRILLSHIWPPSDSPWLQGGGSLWSPNYSDLTPSLTTPPLNCLLLSGPTVVLTKSPSHSHTPGWDLHTHYSSTWNVLMVHSGLNSNVTASEQSSLTNPPPHTISCHHNIALPSVA